MDEMIDWKHIQKLLNTSDLEDREHWDVEGVRFSLPRGEVRKTRDQSLNWQRRVLEDVIPESPNSDAATKIPFKILRGLSSPERPPLELEQALSGEFAPLLPLFVRSTQGKLRIPAAFHVLAVRAPRREINSRIFSEKTFCLLCRSQDGHLNSGLLSQFLERFRRDPVTLDLAQETVLERLSPGWTNQKAPLVFLEGMNKPVRPLFFSPNRLLQDDLRTLLDASLSQADFLEFFNQLLSLHLGLLQPRLASMLNPLMDMLFAELAATGSVSVEEAQQVEGGTHPVHRFEFSLETRVHSAQDERPVRKDSPELLSFVQLSDSLTHFHFNLMLLHRVRELASAYLLSQDFDPQAIPEAVQRPSQLIDRLQLDSDFRRFMLRSSEVLAVRFLRNQLSANQEKLEPELLRQTPGWTGLHVLRAFYHNYNRLNVSKAASTRSTKQGVQITRSLLQRGEYGLIQNRNRVGGYFELGAGLLPLLLLLIIGARQDRIRVDQFWEGLGRYGLRLSPSNQEHLLQRLKSMGLYERFSDAGEANYILNLITVGSEG